MTVTETSLSQQLQKIPILNLGEKAFTHSHPELEVKVEAADKFTQHLIWLPHLPLHWELGAPGNRTFPNSTHKSASLFISESEQKVSQSLSQILNALK